ncbi:MAG: adenylyl-sulfate kinase [Lachnospiraceae bacterium]|nr:adenylyl-sulfate kinase [Lachnospiraceae bacterium]
MTSQVIVLNGPSSSGKSTLARELQTYFRAKDEEYAIVSIDDFLKMTFDEVIYEDDVFEISKPLCTRVVELLESKINVIIDHVITSERIYSQLLESLIDFKVITVHVTCPIDELKKRESARHNRCIGSAEASYEYLFPKEGYDLTVDTYELSSLECIQKIAELSCRDTN